MGQVRPLFCLFLSHDKYSTNLTINEKSVDGVLETRTRSDRIVWADKATDLWRHQKWVIVCCSAFRYYLVFVENKIKRGRVDQC